MVGEKELIQYGAMGIMLLYFMWRDSKMKDRLATNMNQTNKILLLLIDVVSSCPSNVNGRAIRNEEINKIKEEVFASQGVSNV